MVRINPKILSIFILILQILTSSCVKQEIPTLDPANLDGMVAKLDNFSSIDVLSDGGFTLNSLNPDKAQRKQEFRDFLNCNGNE